MTDTMHSKPRNRQELAEAIRRGQAMIEATLGSLTPEEITAEAPDGGWSVKDHVAHLTAWQWMIHAVMQGRPDWEGLGLDEELVRGADIDSVNALLYQKARNQSLEEVARDYRDSTEAVLAQLEKMSDADLFRTYNPDNPNSKDTMLDWIIWNTYGHDEEHENWIGEMLRARSRGKSEL